MREKNVGQWDSGTVGTERRWRKLCIYNSLHFVRVFAAEELWQRLPQTVTFVLQVYACSDHQDL